MPATCAVPVTVVLHQQLAEQSMLQWFSGQSINYRKLKSLKISSRADNTFKRKNMRLSRFLQ